MRAKKFTVGFALAMMLVVGTQASAFAAGRHASSAATYQYPFYCSALSASISNYTVYQPYELIDAPLQVNWSCNVSPTVVTIFQDYDKNYNWMIVQKEFNSSHGSATFLAAESGPGSPGETTTHVYYVYVSNGNDAVTLRGTTAYSSIYFA